MSMKRSLGIMSMFLAISAMNTTPTSGPTNYPSTEPPDQKKRRLDKAKAEISKSNGLKEFSYGENTLWAINQKVADKKAKKRGWI